MCTLALRLRRRIRYRAPGAGVVGKEQSTAMGLPSSREPPLIRLALKQPCSRLFDSVCWGPYCARKDDIIIATYPKAGTKTQTDAGAMQSRKMISLSMKRTRVGRTRRPGHRRVAV